MHLPVFLKLIDDKKRLRGELWFDVWILGFTYDGSRRVDYTSSIENIRTKAVAGENLATGKIDQKFSHSINASASGPNPKMTKPTVTSGSETIAQWKAKPFWQLKYTSPDTGKLDLANTQIVAGMVSLEMRASSPTAVPWSDPVMAYPWRQALGEAGHLGIPELEPFLEGYLEGWIPDGWITLTPDGHH
ncbi:hypothetical protein ACE1OC_23955 [Streptomyces sp. DSM 116496]|uniref:hypothetical protein n=1 Tax=Streptomyces stoeckheimensis TaxID=3344656 RepID=UPI0038B26780